MTTESIEPLIDYRKVVPEAVNALLAVERYARGSNLEPALLELVRLRASIINGCAYCVDMHAKDARANGESEQRLYAVSVWREAPFFTARERGPGLDRSRHRREGGPRPRRGVPPRPRTV
ncbi:MAG: carboxymuconolactone decarboxylase family protein [Bryobacteraceae bacterium]